jgi:ketosteroid isomerase-like protein
MQTENAVLAFITAINAHDVDAIAGLCAEDHQFIDAHGGVVAADQLRAAWTGYFQFMPRYGIEVETILWEGDVAAVFGSAWGCLSADGAAERSWRRPCAWRARVENGRIKLWQVYVDTKAVFDLL